MARADIVSIPIDSFPWTIRTKVSSRSALKFALVPSLTLRSSVQSVSALMVNSKGVYDTVNGRLDNEGVLPKKGLPFSINNLD